MVPQFKLKSKITIKKWKNSKCLLFDKTSSPTQRHYWDFLSIIFSLKLTILITKWRLTTATWQIFNFVCLILIHRRHGIWVVFIIIWFSGSKFRFTNHRAHRLNLSSSSMSLSLSYHNQRHHQILFTTSHSACYVVFSYCHGMNELFWREIRNHFSSLLHFLDIYSW